MVCRYINILYAMVLEYLWFLHATVTYMFMSFQHLYAFFSFYCWVTGSWRDFGHMVIADGVYKVGLSTQPVCDCQVSESLKSHLRVEVGIPCRTIIGHYWCKTVIFRKKFQDTEGVFDLKLESIKHEKIWLFCFYVCQRCLNLIHCTV